MRYPEVRIRVKLLSEAIFDSGEPAANHVHTQVLFDEQGLVYYHAKTFKGQLKKQAYWLYDIYRGAGEENAARNFIETVADLFGFHKEEAELHRIKGVRWRTGIMRLGNLQLPPAVQGELLDWLRRNADGYMHFSPQDLLEAQTQVRAMIQLEDGTVKEGMLRFFQTVKKGLVFESKVEFDAEPTSEQLQQLLRIVRSLDRIGAGVNRGRGRVEASLWINGRPMDSLSQVETVLNPMKAAFPEHSATALVSERNASRGSSMENGNQTEPTAARYYVIEITNEEPLKIGAVGSKSNPSEASRQHLPGSTVRGALLADLSKRLKGDPAALADILRNVHCQSGYLYRGQHLFLPTPQHLRVNKHEYRKKKAERLPVQIFAYGGHAEPEARNQLPDRYVAIGGRSGERELIGGAPKRAYRLHHSTIRKPGEKERENIYNYQAIAPGHTFRAIVYYQGEYGSQLDSWLATGVPQSWQLGGARSAGYGKCAVTVLGRCETYDEAAAVARLDLPRVLFGNLLTLTCLTDGLFRDCFGQPASGIPNDAIENWIAELLPENSENPIRVNARRLYLQTGMSEGYNATWGARYPKETVILAGSVMQYELSADLNEEQWQRLILGLEAVPRGSRTQEGFGWLLANVDYPAYLSTTGIAGTEKMPEVSVATAATPAMTAVAATSTERIQPRDEGERETIRIIRDSLQGSREQWLAVIVERLRSEMKDSEDAKSPSKTQLHISGELRQVHLLRMVSRLQDWLDSRGRKLNTISRDFGKQPEALSKYEKNEEDFSLVGANLQDVLVFLQADAGSDAELDARYKALKDFASFHLASTKGRFYYPETGAERLFIAELLAIVLYMASRERKEERVE